MLLKIEIENFFSIKERITLDFRAGNINSAKSRELADNVMEWNGQKILKTIGLFGPNASGKSNLINVFRFVKDIMLHGIDDAIALQGGTTYLSNAREQDDE